MIKFRCNEEEFERIKSGKQKSISRMVERYNPVFKKIENMNLRVANGYSFGMIDLYCEHYYRTESAKITNISYKDGNVIIKWEKIL